MVCFWGRRFSHNHISIYITGLDKSVALTNWDRQICFTPSQREVTLFWHLQIMSLVFLPISYQRVWISINTGWMAYKTVRNSILFKLNKATDPRLQESPPFFKKSFLFSWHPLFLLMCWVLMDFSLQSLDLTVLSRPCDSVCLILLAQKKGWL